MHILHDMAYSVKWRLRWCDPTGMEGSWKLRYSSRWRSPLTRQGGRSDNDTRMKSASSARPNKVSNLLVKGYTQRHCPDSPNAQNTSRVQGTMSVLLNLKLGTTHTTSIYFFLSLIYDFPTRVSSFYQDGNVLNCAQKLKQLLVGAA